MLTNQKVLDLTNNLANKTAKGTITWGETAEENTFRTILQTGIVRIGRHENPYAQAGEGAIPITTGLPFSTPEGIKPDGEFIYSLFVLDNQSYELGRFISTKQDDAVPLRRLWELAFSVARNPEKKIDSILGELCANQEKVTS